MRIIARCMFVFAVIAGGVASAEELQVAERVDVEPVWSGHRVGFALLTTSDRQYAAYYDADRRMTVAARALDSDDWTIQRLDSRLGWDSHNYVTMALDRAGRLHVTGNMHCVPLIYFRSEKPGDVTSLVRVESMVGDREGRCTYPRFLYDAEGRLLFTYRDGSSGNGARLWNAYDETTSSWKRLHDAPLFDGEGRMNAYFVGPTQGPDGRFHIVWVWRDTPDCATNHDVSYARSDDLVHWEKSDGTPLTLPIRIGTAEIVDPVPAGGGAINGNTRLGFDADGRVIVSYHKYDADGRTQIFNARREADGWNILPATDWDYRWEFGGGGSINFEVGVGAVEARDDGTLVQSFSAKGQPSGTWRLDPETLRAVERVPSGPALPAEVRRIESDFPGMQVRMSGDLADDYAPHGDASPDGWRMRWESRAANRDRPWPGEIPPAAMLRVYRLAEESAE